MALILVRSMAAAIVLSMLAGASAWGSGRTRGASNPFCASLPRLPWLSSEEIEARLRERGYEMIRLRMADDRCYAASVREPSGKFRQLIVHPVTAEIVAQ